MGFKEAWASLGKWERRSAMFGGVLIAAAAGMYIDTEFIRPDYYRALWQEERDKRWAKEVHDLLRPEQRGAPRPSKDA
ncbi:hypothetical protein PLESTM_001832700 [Pleodorina starrii]|nr:hypothetical protein PLESTM_001832700 [Pleodorina starrii]